LTPNCIDIGRIIRRPQVGGDAAYSTTTKGKLLGSGCAAPDLKVRVRVAPADTLFAPEPGYPAEERTITQTARGEDGPLRSVVAQQQQ
jgi:hypothetical protein